MSALLKEDRPPNEAGGSDAYNQLQAQGAVKARGARAAETSVRSDARELLRVLIVDNYRAAADSMAMLLGIWGHDVRRAYDGTTGLALAAAFQPDVLLLEIALPGMSGMELAGQVRRQVRLNDCRMIAVTGRTEPGLRVQCGEAGIDVFLIKPVHASILQTLLTVEFEYRRSHASPAQLPFHVLQPIPHPHKKKEADKC